jgi:general stress protein YciG
MAKRPHGKGKQGFASMPRDRRHAIAVAGGRAAHQHGAHEWTSEEAREAGRKGGVAARTKRRKREPPVVAAHAAAEPEIDWSAI